MAGTIDKGGGNQSNKSFLGYLMAHFPIHHRVKTSSRHGPDVVAIHEERWRRSHTQRVSLVDILLNDPSSVASLDTSIDRQRIQP